MEVSQIQDQSAQKGLKKLSDPPGPKRVLASDLGPLVEFIAARVEAVHHCLCGTIREAPAEASAARRECESDHEKTIQPWRVLVAIGGIPGSGKSTLAARLKAALNAYAINKFCKCLMPTLTDRTWETHGCDIQSVPVTPEAVGIVSIDGFHLTRSELDHFPDPAEAHRRRGAPWTFDLQAFWAALRHLKTRLGPVVFPTFDHAKKDPDSNGCVIAAETRVVLVEGLYTLIFDEGFSATPALFDARIFIDTPKSVATARVIQRHVTSGISCSEDEAEIRWLESDSLNADYILGKLQLEHVDVVVQGDA